MLKLLKSMGLIFKKVSDKMKIKYFVLGSQLIRYLNLGEVYF